MERQNEMKGALADLLLDLLVLRLELLLLELDMSPRAAQSCGREMKFGTAYLIIYYILL